MTKPFPFNVINRMRQQNRIRPALLCTAPIMVPPISADDRRLVIGRALIAAATAQALKTLHQTDMRMPANKPMWLGAGGLMTESGRIR